VVLTCLKCVAGYLSGSISIISEALHSFSDFFASVLTYFSVSKSSQPADDDHPYGHGKYEDMAAFIEGGLIIFAAVFIFYKAVLKIINNVPVEAENNIGIIVMIIAVVCNIAVSTMLFRVAKESGSVSLQADGEHIRTDVYSSLGILFGLVLIKLTGYYLLDPIIAIGISLFIFIAGLKIIKQAWFRLVDHSLPDDDINIIIDIVKNIDNVKLKDHSIKARQIGPSKDIDLVLQFPENTTICQCHKICDEVESKIQEVFVNSSISIHLEPMCYKNDCVNCANKK
jgi:cation diffusion facilitator family transporter